MDNKIIQKVPDEKDYIPRVNLETPDPKTNWVIEFLKSLFERSREKEIKDETYKGE